MAHKVKNSIIYVSVCLSVILLISGAVEADDFAVGKALEPSGFEYTGIRQLKEIEPNLTGEDVNIAVICRSFTYIDGEPQNDYRPNNQHSCLEDKQFSFYDHNDIAAGLSPHSTAVCSILFGRAPNAFHYQTGEFNYQGIIPDAQASIYEFWYLLTNNVFTGSGLDVHILTASIGTQFEDWWTRGIESLAEKQGLIVISGIGNGSNVNDSALYPAASSNAIGVGVIDSVKADILLTELSNFSLAYPNHSSVGPTTDNRCKPDIVAPGNYLVADINDINSYSPAGSWCSFATPVVAGTAGLLVQKAIQEPNLSSAISADGGNCVIKAILMNSATKLPFWHKGRLDKNDDHTAVLDYIQGAGVLNATAAYENLIAGPAKPEPNLPLSPSGWDNNELQSDKKTELVYRLDVNDPNGKFITATLAWNRCYEAVYPFRSLPEKDGNLRLEVWAFDSNNSYYLIDFSDSNTDNVEHIYCALDANYTNYEISVSYSDSDLTDSDKSTRFGLAWGVRAAKTNDNILWYDLNSDGIVNKLDLNILLDNWLASIESSQNYTIGDINSDGAIDANDFKILTNHINQKAVWYNE